MDSNTPEKLFLTEEDLVAESQRSAELEALAEQEKALTEALKDGLASVDETIDTTETQSE